MINLLSPEVKKQIQYSKYNTVLIHYMVLVVVVAIFLSLVMLGGTFFAQREISSLQSELDTRGSLIGDLKNVEREAKAFEAELETVEQLFDQESKFSIFLGELSSVIPPWAKLDSLQLARPEAPTQTVTLNEEGEPVVTQSQVTDDGKTLDISFIIRDASDAAVLRKNLLELPRIQFVDIQNVSVNEVEGSSNTSVSLKLALAESPDKIYVPPEEEQ